jgi:hypothetical protein
MDHDTDVAKIIEVVEERLGSDDGQKLVDQTTRDLDTYRSDLDERIRVDPRSVPDRVTLEAVSDYRGDSACRRGPAFRTPPTLCG